MGANQTPVVVVMGKRSGEDMEVDNINAAKKGRTEGEEAVQKKDGEDTKGTNKTVAGLPKQSCEAQ